MAYVKYTKTATFLFPFIGIPKSIFSCNVKNSFGSTKFTTRFHNAYIGDCQIEDYKEGFVFVVVKAFQDVDFQCFYDTMTAFENHVDDYERGNFIVFVYSVLDKFMADYNLVMDGQYSKVSADAKKAILQNNFFSGKPYTLPLILNKSEALKNSWEKRLDANLYDQEVWSIIMPEKEKMCDEILEELVEGGKLKPTGEFEK